VASLDDAASAGTDPGATTGSTTPEAPTDPEEAMLAFTECMRDHGIDMPDPQRTAAAGGAGESGPAVIALEVDPNDEGFKDAQEACEPLMENVRQDMDIDPAKQAEMKEQMLAFSQCMRDHGIDMPDPTFDENGGVSINRDEGDGPPPERDTAKFEAAAEECGQDGMFSAAAPAGGGDGPVTQSDGEGG
jgi:hypothetical protein